MAIVETWDPRGSESVPRSVSAPQPEPGSVVTPEAAEYERELTAQYEQVARQVADRPKVAPDTSWRATASCRDTDPDLFFPVGTTGNAITQIETAKQVCRGCVAQLPCLEFALRSNQDSGVWGGTSEEERRHLRRTFLRRRRTEV